jgi:hypothetical protein
MRDYIASGIIQTSSLTGEHFLMLFVTLRLVGGRFAFVFRQKKRVNENRNKTNFL